MTIETSTVETPVRKTWFTTLILRYGTLIMIGLLVIFFANMEEAFLSGRNIANILRSISITSLVAMGVTVSLSVDGFDLSVGSMAGFAGVLASSMMIWYEQNLMVSILVPLIFGMLVGAINAFLVVVIGIDDILATLGMMFVVRGVLQVYAHGVAVHNYMLMPDGTVAPGVVSDAFLFLGQGSVGPVPFSIIIMFVMVAIMYVFMNNTRFGRYLYVIGGNREAAYLSGIKVDWYRTVAYMVSGLLAAAGGVLLASRLGTGELRGGEPFLMDAVMASFVGVSVLATGKPNIFGTFIGAIFTGIMLNGLTMMNVPPTALDIFKGGVLILAVGLSAIQQKRLANF
jgi:simple sugar transport system permease protein